MVKNHTIRHFWLLGILCGIAIWMNPLQSHAAEVIGEEEFEIEQIQENAPTLNFYIRTNLALDKENLEVWVGDSAQEITSVETFSETKEIIHYYFLMDVSASIPNDYFEAQKQCLTNYIGTNEQNQISIISFGDEAKKICETSQNTSEEMMLAINELKNTDQETHLFDAIKMTTDLINANTQSERNIVVIFSDGEDFATGKTTRGEVEKLLSEKNIPLYAFGIDSTKDENLNNFGELARTLGGELSIFSVGNLEESFAEFLQKIDKSVVVSCLLESNYIDNEAHNCVISEKNKKINRNRAVIFNTYQIDSEAPFIISTQLSDENNSLYIQFSEPILLPENINDWNLSYQQKKLQVASVGYGNDKTIAVVQLEQKLYAGQYTIFANNLTDNSMEKNRMEVSYEFQIEGSKAALYQDMFIKFLQSYWWIIVLVIIVIIIAVVIAKIWKKIKSEKGIVFADGKAVLAKNVSEKQRIEIEEKDDFKIWFEFIHGTVPEKIKIEMDRSLIVGRAEYCDVVINDSKISKQHFALEYEEGNMFIQDLQSTNGTKLNGVSVTTKQKVEVGDKIEAGNVLLRIGW